MGEPSLTERFAREVRAEKGRRHLFNSDISRATGIPESRLSRKLRMDNPDEFTLNEVQLIADYLDIEVAELMALARNKYIAFLEDSLQAAVA